jgi:hypothetical protein
MPVLTVNTDTLESDYTIKPGTPLLLTVNNVTFREADISKGRTLLSFKFDLKIEAPARYEGWRVFVDEILTFDAKGQGILPKALGRIDNWYVQAGLDNPGYKDGTPLDTDQVAADLTGQQITGIAAIREREEKVEDAFGDMTTKTRRDKTLRRVNNSDKPWDPYEIYGAGAYENLDESAVSDSDSDPFGDAF